MTIYKNLFPEIKNALKQYLLIIFISSFVYSGSCYGQNLFTPRSYDRSISKQTRDTNGIPGNNYWQNTANYNLNISIIPAAKLLTGKATITYYNNSPDTLKRILIKLFQNLHTPYSAKAHDVDTDYFTGGMEITKCLVGGKNIYINNDSLLQYGDGTNLWLDLPKPLTTTDSVVLVFDWQYKIATDMDSHREGVIDSASFFIAYFFPRIAVYDDVFGWNNTQYNDQVEFYNDFCNFDYTITVPQNYQVWATGDWLNANEILDKQTLKKYNAAMSSTSEVNIFDSLYYFQKSKDNRQTTKQNAFKFKASNISDIAFAVSSHYYWRATSVDVKGKKVFTSVVYNSRNISYANILDMASKSVTYFANEWPGTGFPFSHMTLFNGYGQMEFPMMCNDVHNENVDDDITLTTHEISHTYFPFEMGINETRFAWMDEGWAVFFEYMASVNAFKLKDSTATYPAYYFKKYIASKSLDLDVPMMAPSDVLFEKSYGFNSYGKPAAALFALKAMLGDSLFKICLQKYMSDWRGKHPQPWDFFFSFNNTSKRNLNWFWQNWYYDWGRTDWAITDVEKQTNSETIITLENIGGKIFPVDIYISTADTTTVYHHVPQTNARIFTITATGNDITKVQLKFPMIPDVNKLNDVWEK